MRCPVRGHRFHFEQFARAVFLNFTPVCCLTPVPLAFALIPFVVASRFRDFFIWFCAYLTRTVRPSFWNLKCICLCLVKILLMRFSKYIHGWRENKSGKNHHSGLISLIRLIEPKWLSGGRNSRNSGVQRCFQSGSLRDFPFSKNQEPFPYQGPMVAVIRFSGRSGPVVCGTVWRYLMFSVTGLMLRAVFSNEQIFLLVCHIRHRSPPARKQSSVDHPGDHRHYMCARQIQRRFHNFRLGCPLSWLLGE